MTYYIRSVTKVTERSDSGASDQGGSGGPDPPEKTEGGSEYLWTPPEFDFEKNNF